MKLSIKKIKLLLISCFALVAVAFGTLAFNANNLSAQASGTTIGQDVFATDGASMRIFRTISDTVPTDKQGLRFHVEMGNGYSINEKTVVNVSATNEHNGSFQLNEGFKTYTLIIPTRLLNGELTVNTDKVMKLNTSNYWYEDNDGNLESIAYVYNIPETRYTDMFSYRGVICDADDNVLAQTPVSERCVAEIAKKSYQATEAGTENWGNEARTNLAKEALLSFIPHYTLVYNDAEEQLATETVLWGDAPQNVPTGEFNTWYNETSSEEVNVNKVMTYSESKTITLTATKAEEFSLTGIADIDNVVFTDSEGNQTSYNGARVFATLPQGVFKNNDAFDLDAVNVEYQGNGTFGGIQKAFVLEEGGDTKYYRIVFAFDSSTMVSGDKIIIRGDSVFYFGGKMYKLTKDYEISYVLQSNGTEDYSIFLGYIHNSDVKSMENYEEMRGGQLAKVIRIEFYDDVFVNSNFTFENTDLPEGYEFPVYIHCPDAKTDTQITGGYYYWNDGEHQILELNGYGNHNKDELFGAPGTKLIQNGGYYIFEEAMYAYYNGTAWVVGKEKGTFSTTSFASVVGTQYNDGNKTNELRFDTTENWFDKVTPVTTENMSETEPYAIYHTSADGEVTEMTSFIYHGASTSIFAFRDFEGTEAGETITIIKGTRIWSGSDYWTASEDIIFYFNGANWIVGSDGSADTSISYADFTGQNLNFFEANTHSIRMYVTPSLFNANSGILVVENGAVMINQIPYTNLKYHGLIQTNEGPVDIKILEIMGDSSNALGKTAFSDTLTIKAGTKLWLNEFCVMISEEINLIFVGENNIKDGSGNDMNRDWVPAKNTNIKNADIINMYDTVDSAGGEVRFNLKDGIITDNFYGFMAMDTSKGIPVVNGVEMPNQAFCYNQGNDLMAVRGGQYGAKMPNGAYISIPAGSVWYSTQGSFTFIEEIIGVYTGSAWVYGFDTSLCLDTITNDHVERLYIETNVDQSTGNPTSIELRMQVSKDLEGFNYYGSVAMIGNAYLTKQNGTVINNSYGYWYGGNSTTYNGHEHSLIGFRAPSISALDSITEGDVITIEKGTKIVFRTASGVEGYHVIGEDLIYTYTNGTWLEGDQTTTVTYTVSNATVNVPQKVIIGTDYSFSVEPNSGYTVSSITVNGNAITLNANNTYTVTAESTNEIVVETVKGFNVTFSVADGATVDGGAIKNGTIKAIANGNSLTFAVSANSGYVISGVSNAINNGDGTYTVTPNADINVAITTKHTYSVTFNIEDGALVEDGEIVNGTVKSVTEGESITFSVSAESGYEIKAVTGVTTDDGNGTYTVTPTANTTVSVTILKIYNVTWSNPTGATITVEANETGTVTNGGTVYAGQTITVTIVAKDNYRLDTVSGLGSATVSNKDCNGTNTFTVSNVGADVDISATTVKMYKVSWNAKDGTEITCQTSGLPNGGWVDNGTTVTFNISLSSGYKDLKVSGATNTSGSTYSATVNGANVSVEASATSCLVEGTMVMMADGSMKAVDNIVAGDKVMVFNHETGKYEAGTIWFNDHANDPARLRNVINLEFANGATARIAYEHGYFDLDLMRYVFIREDNMHEFIGHRFVTTTFNGTEVIQGETTLVRAYVTEEVVKVYGPITEYHFNLVTDEMLSMPSFNFDATGMVNIFEYDADLKYNAEMMQADIETYGLFTYEEFAEYMSYEDYCKAPIAYFKVAIGKGNLTWEQIELTLNYLAVNEF
ncbi:MAG: hypothetical protein IKA99_07840 [Clostridia bacterium]|nr:hypothetical protein [Clostridia bacterium]